MVLFQECNLNNIVKLLFLKEAINSLSILNLLLFSLVNVLSLNIKLLRGSLEFISFARSIFWQLLTLTLKQRFDYSFQRRFSSSLPVLPRAFYFVLPALLCLETKFKSTMSDYYLSFFSLSYLILAALSLHFRYYCFRLSPWYLYENCQKCLKPISTCPVMLLGLCWINKNHHHSFYQLVKFALCHLYLRILFLILDFVRSCLVKQGRLILFILLGWSYQKLQLYLLRKSHLLSDSRYLY